VFIKQPFEECWRVKTRETILTGRAASIGKTTRESTQKEMKPCRMYVSVGGREILKCILKNGV